MAARHLLQRSVLRPATLWALSRNTIQRPVSMATQKSCLPDPACQRIPSQSQPCASFHSSTRLLDENYFNVQDSEDFKTRVLGSDSVVVVDFHADWCNPCKALAPVLDQAVKNSKGQVKLAKVDIDELQDLAVNYGVNAVPTVVAFKGGREVSKFIGVQPQDKVDAFVEKLLT